MKWYATIARLANNFCAGCLLKSVARAMQSRRNLFDRCGQGAQRIRCVWGKTAFSGIHELCESF